jgi:hypothetical protein
VADDEEELAKLQQQREELLQALATDTIEDKNTFFAKLDLKSRDGRVRANGLLKRLKILVFFDPAEQRYEVVKDGVLAFVVIDRKTDGPPDFFPADNQSRSAIERQEKKFRPFWNRDDDYDESEDNYQSEGHDSRDGY